MKQDRVELLDGARTRERVANLIARGGPVKLAVAFWGEGADTTLGLKNARDRLQIICNLESGNSNPDVLRPLLRGKSCALVATDPQLHAKLYWTEHGAVIGSSNASANGLGNEGDEVSGLHEINVFVPPGALLRQVEYVFDEMLSNLGSAALLTYNDPRWEIAAALRASRGPKPMPIKLTTSLCAAYRNQPDWLGWSKVKVGVWAEGPNARDKRALESAQDTIFVGTELPSYWAGWNDRISAGDVLVTCRIIKDRVCRPQYWAVGDSPIRHKHLTFVEKKTRLLVSDHPPLLLEDEDWLEMHDLFKTWYERSRKDRESLQPISRFMAATTHSRPFPFLLNG